MNTHLKNLLQWFCRRLTFNEFYSIVPIIHEILSGKCRDFEFKPETSERSEHYRKFNDDSLPPLTEPPKQPPETAPEAWLQLLTEYKLKTGRELKKVRRKPGSIPLPEYCHCEYCGAPEPYLYLNDGQKGNQIRCKVCDRLSTSNRTRRESKAKYFCPYCGYALYHWKELALESVYKCPNDNCTHYLDRLTALTRAEKKAREINPYDPNYKLRYQYREYHIEPSNIKCTRPDSESKVNLKHIRNSLHTAGLVLSLTINLGLSSRMTQKALNGLFGIDISHQTVMNYMNAAATALAPWLDRNMPQPKAEAAGDETYIIVENEWHYTWFIVDIDNRAICGWNISNTRGIEPALATFINTFGTPDSNPNQKYLFIHDGLPTYRAATAAYNQQAGHTVIETKMVVGLENNDHESAEYRKYKQIIERLNRTYKFHTRPRAGFKNFNGSVTLTTLFVVYYNYLRPHTTLQNSVPIPLIGLSDNKSWPKQWEKLLELAIT